MLLPFADNAATNTTSPFHRPANAKSISSSNNNTNDDNKDGDQDDDDSSQVPHLWAEHRRNRASQKVVVQDPALRHNTNDRPPVSTASTSVRERSTEQPLRPHQNTRQPNLY